MVGARKGPHRSLGFAFGYGRSQLRANNLFGGREHRPSTQRSPIGAACGFSATFRKRVTCHQASLHRETWDGDVADPRCPGAANYWLAQSTAPQLKI